VYVASKCATAPSFAKDADRLRGNVQCSLRSESELDTFAVSSDAWEFMARLVAGAKGQGSRIQESRLVNLDVHI